MAPRSQGAFDYLRAIETLSQTEEGMSQAVEKAAPGGEAYDFAPAPPAPGQEKGKLLQLANRAKQLVSNVAEKIPHPSELADRTSKQTERFQRRAAIFLKHNGPVLAGTAFFAASFFIARKYRRSR